MRWYDIGEKLLTNKTQKIAGVSYLTVEGVMRVSESQT